MKTVRFYEEIDDELLRFAVIITKAQGKWVFCKHRERDTWELPGGHREPGEDIYETARRELYEETGAVDFDIRKLCVYSVEDSEKPDRGESFGMLYAAQVRKFEPELHSEIERILLSEHLAEDWTYPEIQPRLIEEYERRGGRQ